MAKRKVIGAEGQTLVLSHSVATIGLCGYEFEESDEEANMIHIGKMSALDNGAIIQPDLCLRALGTLPLAASCWLSIEITDASQRNIYEVDVIAKIFISGRVVVLFNKHCQMIVSPTLQQELESQAATKIYVDICKLIQTDDKKMQDFWNNPLPLCDVNTRIEDFDRSYICLCSELMVQIEENKCNYEFTFEPYFAVAKSRDDDDISLMDYSLLNKLAISFDAEVVSKKLGFEVDRARLSKCLLKKLVFLDYCNVNNSPRLSFWYVDDSDNYHFVQLAGDEVSCLLDGKHISRHVKPMMSVLLQPIRELLVETKEIDE